MIVLGNQEADERFEGRLAKNADPFAVLCGKRKHAAVLFCSEIDGGVIKVYVKIIFPKGNRLLFCRKNGRFPLRFQKTSPISRL